MILTILKANRNKLLLKKIFIEFNFRNPKIFIVYLLYSLKYKN